MKLAKKRVLNLIHNSVADDVLESFIHWAAPQSKNEVNSESWLKDKPKTYFDPSRKPNPRYILGGSSYSPDTIMLVTETLQDLQVNSPTNVHKTAIVIARLLQDLDITFRELIEHTPETGTFSAVVLERTFFIGSSLMAEIDGASESGVHNIERDHPIYATRLGVNVTGLCQTKKQCNALEDVVRVALLNTVEK